MTNVATRFQPDISGNTIPAGFIFETQTITPTSTTISSTNTDTDISGSSFTLTAGTWLVFYSCQIQCTGTTGFVTIRTKLYNTTDSATVAGSIAASAITTSASSGDFVTNNCAMVLLQISSTKSYKLQAARGGGSNSSVANTSFTDGLTDPDSSSRIQIVRIG